MDQQQSPAVVERKEKHGLSTPAPESDRMSANSRMRPRASWQAKDMAVAPALPVLAGGIEKLTSVGK